MRLFNRQAKLRHPPLSALASISESGRDANSAEGEVRASRTIVKSELEVAELVAREPRLKDERIEVTLAEKGFGTRVAIVADGGGGLEEADLESLLDQLAEPQKRPFSNS